LGRRKPITGSFVAYRALPGGFGMAPEDWFARYGRMGVIVAAFAFIGAIVAEPLLRPIWSPQVTIAQLAPGGLR
jgi:hypothetical protein